MYTGVRRHPSGSLIMYTYKVVLSCILEYDAIPQDFVNLGFSPEGVSPEKLRASGITDGLAFAFRQLSAACGPRKISYCTTPECTTLRCAMFYCATQPPSQAALGRRRAEEDRCASRRGAAAAVWRRAEWAGARAASTGEAFDH